MNIEIITVPALKDNLCYLVHAGGNRQADAQAIVIDPSEAGPIQNELKLSGLRLGLILNTHHHHDHVGGNLELARMSGAPIYCSHRDLARVPGATRGLKHGEQFSFHDLEFEVLEIPGHTSGQIAFYQREAYSGSGALFVGDTVFSMGCGRLYEGTPDQMLASLLLIMKLKSETRIHFGHEYTIKNGAFAKMVEPQNAEIAKRVAKTEAYLKRNDSAPAPSLAEEKLVNPFMRTMSRDIRAQLKLEKASDLEVFTRLREMRNNF